MALPLEGKVAVVTGAGRMRSIGRPIAVELARAGCDVVITGSGRPPETYPADEQAAGWRDIASVAEEIEGAGRRALAVVNDVTDAEAVDALADRVVTELGRVDVVVNNAGAARGADRVPVIDVNLHGSFHMSRSFGRHLVAQGEGGSITNISSIAGKLLPANAAAYAASKAGLQALTAAMAREVAPNGIRVNALCVGIVDTSRLDDVPRGPAFEEMIRRNVPLGRAGTGEDIANMVVFLASEAGAWITGQSYNVDGGQVVTH
jgi:3-oxoacyl-[acyl-carrier protein] reductase